MERRKFAFREPEVKFVLISDCSIKDKMVWKCLLPDIEMDQCWGAF